MTTSAEYWKLFARCQGLQPPEADWFFSDDYLDKQRAKREYCAWCDVRKACLNYAIDTDTWIGVWGGMTADERSRYEMQRKRRGL